MSEYLGMSLNSRPTLLVKTTGPQRGVHRGERGRIGVRLRRDRRAKVGAREPETAVEVSFDKVAAGVLTVLHELDGLCHPGTVAFSVRRSDAVAHGPGERLDEGATARGALGPVTKVVARRVDHHLLLA